LGFGHNTVASTQPSSASLRDSLILGPALDGKSRASLVADNIGGGGKADGGGEGGVKAGRLRGGKGADADGKALNGRDDPANDLHTVLPVANTSAPGTLWTSSRHAHLNAAASSVNATQALVVLLSDDVHAAAAVEATRHQGRARAAVLLFLTLSCALLLLACALSSGAAARVSRARASLKRAGCRACGRWATRWPCRGRTGKTTHAMMYCEADELLACPTAGDVACARLAIGLEEAAATLPSSGASARSPTLSHLSDNHSETISASISAAGTASTHAQSSLACVPQFAWDGESTTGSSTSIAFDLLTAKRRECVVPPGTVGEKCMLGVRSSRFNLGERGRQEIAAADFVAPTSGQSARSRAPPSSFRNAPLPPARSLDLDADGPVRHRSISAHPAVRACSYAI